MRSRYILASLLWGHTSDLEKPIGSSSDFSFVDIACDWQGTTTNGKFLLPFKSGAFLAGVPVQPVILQYGEVSVFFFSNQEYIIEE